MIDALSWWSTDVMGVEIYLIEIAMYSEKQTTNLCTYYWGKTQILLQPMLRAQESFNPMKEEQGAEERIERLLNGQPCWSTLS